MEPTVIHPNLKFSSPSSDELFRRCKRKFQLYRLGNMNQLPINQEEDGDVNLSFGSVVGAGVQEILRTNNLADAYIKIFCMWKKDLDDEDGDSKKKSFWDALIAIDNFMHIRNNFLQDYELVEFDGEPALELGCHIDCGDGFYHRNKLDALLMNKRTKELVCFEAKTTGMRYIHEAMYKNAEQGLGYGIIVDAIAHRMGIDVGSSYKVKYCIYMTHKREWEIYDFTKSLTSKVMWIKNRLMHKRDVSLCAEENYFPMQGESCLAYGRPCKYFDICHMDDKIILRDIDKIPLIDLEEDKKKYKFHFTLDEIIEAQIAKQIAAAS